MDVPRIAQVLASLDADIIGLQEVDWRHPTEAIPDPFAYLAAALNMRAVEGPNLRDHRGHYGNGLLTRFPAMNVERIPLAYGGREPRGAIHATLDGGDRPIQTLVTHLGLKFRERRAQVRMLRTAIAKTPPGDARLMMGDMNEWIARALMRHAFTPTPFSRMVTGRTFPSKWPLFPLDCIFAGPSKVTLEAHVARTPETRIASDHLPLVADIEWAPVGVAD